MPLGRLTTTGERGDDLPYTLSEVRTNGQLHRPGSSQTLRRRRPESLQANTIVYPLEWRARVLAMVIHGGKPPSSPPPTRRTAGENSYHRIQGFVESSMQHLL